MSLPKQSESVEKEFRFDQPAPTKHPKKNERVRKREREKELKDK